MMLKEKEAIDLRVEEYEEVSGEGTWRGCGKEWKERNVVILFQLKTYLKLCLGPSEMKKAY